MVSSTQTNYSSYYICTRYDESYDGLAACTGNQIQPPYLLQVPAQSISFTLTATDPNHPPKDPTITPQTSNNFYKDSVQKFDISSIDPDGDTIKYCASWTQPGACEISSAYYSSGATWTLKKTFSDSGDHTLYVQATDSHGSKSGWSSRIFRIRGLPQNGACSLTTPHICTTEESTVTTNDTPTQYKWTCGGINGGNPSPTCVLNIPINAKCGGTKYSCQLGNPDTPYDSPTNYYWNCIGINNGSTNYCHLPKLPSCSSCTTDASCSLPITNSSCGTTGIKYTCQPGASYSTAPSTATDFLWRCGTESCSAPIPTCGMTAGSCPNGGTASSITTSDTESNWICSLSGSTKSCSAPIIQPGNCGDVTYNTCDSGNPSGLAETNGYYTWICSGSSPQSCSLPAPVCDTSVEHTCRKGTPINIKDTRADYLWDCKLSGGVKSCTIAQSNCGTADNYSFATSDTGYGSFTQCRTGFTPSSTAFPDQGQSLTWICGGEKCRAGHNLDAVCGSQNGIPSLLQPSNKTSTSLCLKGSPPEFITKNTVTDKWEWECGGMLNGKSAPCSAPISHFKFWEF
ncbi:hypothetical protein D4R99_05185 [bacterium]|nr:MAG: hypothetical protein D4R99_05185 [bacterium]